MSKKQRVEIDVEVPDGWRLNGLYRRVITYDYYMPQEGSIAQWLDYDSSEDAYLIAVKDVQ